MNLGIIGLGEQTVTQLLPALEDVSQSITVTALCDTNASALTEVSKKFPQATSYTEYQTLLEEEKKLDAVLVCVPHFLYFDICFQAFEKGIPVIKEKPLAMNAQQTAELLAKSKETNVPIYTLTKRQFFESYNLAQEWLQRIGTVYQYGAYHYISVGNLYEGWRSNPEIAGGGVFGDMGYHLIDVIVRLFGKVTTAALVSTNKGKPEFEYEVEDAASSLFVHQNGVKGSFQLACLCGPKDERLEIRGSEGAIIVNKKSAQLFTVHGDLLEEHSFDTSGNGATTQALEEFFTMQPELLEKNMQQNAMVVEAIEKAYRNEL